jgi:hypothetical protein
VKNGLRGIHEIQKRWEQESPGKEGLQTIVGNSEIG